jgi:hypothetical protein
MSIRALVPAALLGLALCLGAAPAASADQPPSDVARAWAVSLYGGTLSPDGFREWFVPPVETEDHHVAALSVSKGLGALSEHWRWADGTFFLDGLDLEAEAIAAWHWGPFRGDEQEYAEGAASLNIRYRELPWDHVVDTSFGFGLGLSLTSEVPEHEVRVNGDSQELLTYMMVDATLALPAYPAWQLLLRVHHRSGVWGLMSGIMGGSNYLTMGLKYEF